MNFYAQTLNSVPNFLLRFSLIISLFLFQSLAGSSQNTTSIGVIIDVTSETGKQQRTAMQIAAQSFNLNIVIFFRDSGRNPLQAASAGEYYYIKTYVLNTYLSCLSKQKLIDNILLLVGFQLKN